MEWDETKPANISADDQIGRAITLGATAGVCRLWAREAPETAPGMTRAADAYSERAAGLLTDWADGQ